jgi:DNA segregation ATPase FtsK/SpoIIIE-like protein
MIIGTSLFRKKIYRLFVVSLGIAALLGGAFFLLLAFLSYESLDVSWNTGTETVPQNWMGFSGAYTADFCMQWWGKVSYLWILGLILLGGPVFQKGSFKNLIKRLCGLFLSVSGGCLGATLFSPYAGGALGAFLLMRFPWIGNPWGYSFVWTLSGLLFLKCCGVTTALFQKILSGIKTVFSLPIFYGEKILEKTWGLGKNIALLERSVPILEKSDDSFSLITEDEGWDESSFETFSPPKKAHEPRKRDLAALRKPSKSSPWECSKDYSLPPLGLLKFPEARSEKVTLNTKWLEAQAKALHQVLEDFGVRGRIVAVHPGPVVTLYELEPAAGLKSSRVIGLADDIARSMSAISARVAIVPGRNVIGIELPNVNRESVLLRELLEPLEEKDWSEKLALALGKDISGKPVIADLSRMPHLLVAGTTGSGKSVGINAMILSLVYRLPPERCRFIMIDPKMLELSVYDGIPHLLTPVVTDPKKAVVALKWTVREMENRYRAMSQLGVRNIEGYNQRVLEAFSEGEALKRTVQVGFDDTGKPLFEEQPLKLQSLPFIVVIVDEMADLMLVAGKEIESAVQRLAQMARAAGIHLIMATQRPSVDVITGTIKANFPTRISFQVTSKIDSRTILGEQGAEQLLGQGDMLYMASGGRIVRVHGPFVSDQEVEKVVGFLKTQGDPSYAMDLLDAFEGSEKESAWGDMVEGGQDDLYRQAVEVVLRHKKASTSFVQRQLQIGYNRAARMIERMENEGVVSPANHSGKREILTNAIQEKNYA